MGIKCIKVTTLLYMNETLCYKSCYVLVISFYDWMLYKNCKLLSSTRSVYLIYNLWIDSEISVYYIITSG